MMIDVFHLYSIIGCNISYKAFIRSVFDFFSLLLRPCHLFWKSGDMFFLSNNELHHLNCFYMRKVLSFYLFVKQVTDFSLKVDYHLKFDGFYSNRVLFWRAIPELVVRVAR